MYTKNKKKVLILFINIGTDILKTSMIFMRDVQQPDLEGVNININLHQTNWNEIQLIKKVKRNRWCKNRVFQVPITQNS